MDRRAPGWGKMRDHFLGNPAPGEMPRLITGVGLHAAGKLFIGTTATSFTQVPPRSFRVTVHG